MLNNILTNLIFPNETYALYFDMIATAFVCVENIKFRKLECKSKDACRYVEILCCCFYFKCYSLYECMCVKFALAFHPLSSPTLGVQMTIYCVVTKKGKLITVYVFEILAVFKV